MSEINSKRLRYLGVIALAIAGLAGYETRAHACTGSLTGCYPSSSNCSESGRTGIAECGITDRPQAVAVTVCNGSGGGSCENNGALCCNAEAFRSGGISMGFTGSTNGQTIYDDFPNIVTQVQIHCTSYPEFCN